MTILYLDFESFYDSAQDYDLKSISMCEYIRDPRFKAFGAGIAFDDEPIIWVKGEDLVSYFDDVDWEHIDVIGQNIKFDGAILVWQYGHTPRSYIDTKGMSRAVLGKTIKNHSLATLAEYFGMVEKGHLKTNGLSVLTVEQEKELAEYCINDVELTRQIYKQLAKKFPSNQYSILDQTIRMFVEPKLQLNVPLLQKTAVEENRRRENIFKEIGIDKKEFASNKKFPELLIKEGYEVPTKVSPRTNKTIPALALGDTEFLEMLEGSNGRLKTLCEARVAAKSTLLETRSTKLASIGGTGAWPFDVEFSGADQTHRFSGGSGAGGNPQNFTRNSALRKAVGTSEQNEMVVGDFSNIELRLVAYLSKDPGLVKAIEKGKDVYCDFASAFYGRTITKADEAERRFGKTAILGLGYGMGHKKFIKTVRIQTDQVINEETSKKAVELYRIRYAQVPALWAYLDNLIIEMLDNSGGTKTKLPVEFDHEKFVLPSGLEVRFPNLRQEQGEKHTEWVYDVYVKGQLQKRKLYGGKVLENICQALTGELTKTAMERMGKDVVGQCHDELLVICKKGLGPTMAQKLKRVMSLSPSWLPDMKVDAEIKVGNHWGIK